MIERDAPVFVAGGETYVGRALLRVLDSRGYTNVTSDAGAADALRSRDGARELLAAIRPTWVFHAAGDSGGIHANRIRPAELARDNLAVTLNAIDAAHEFEVAKLVYLASSCSYPRETAQPMRPEQLWSGALEPTNQAYAAAKLAGIELCRAYRRQYDDDFIVAIPSNPFGPGEDFSLEDSHVIPALIRRFHEARESGRAEVEMWGSGKPRRDFLYVDDVASAALAAMERYSDEPPINLGADQDLSIRELAETIAEVVGFEGELAFDPSKPDGTPVKTLDASVLAGLGWTPSVPFREALERTYRDYLERYGALAPTTPEAV